MQTVTKTKDRGSQQIFELTTKTEEKRKIQNTTLSRIKIK